VFDGSPIPTSNSNTRPSIRKFSFQDDSGRYFFINGVQSQFTVGQFMSPDRPSYILICDYIVYYLHKISNHFDGEEIVITYGHRTPEYNANMNPPGSPNSRHTSGKAVDFRVGPNDNEALQRINAPIVQQLVREWGFGSDFGHVINYGRGTHIDTRSLR